MPDSSANSASCMGFVTCGLWLCMKAHCSQVVKRSSYSLVLYTWWHKTILPLSGNHQSLGWLIVMLACQSLTRLMVMFASQKSFCLNYFNCVRYKDEIGIYSGFRVPSRQVALILKRRNCLYQVDLYSLLLRSWSHLHVDRHLRLNKISLAVMTRCFGAI